VCAKGVRATWHFLAFLFLRKEKKEKTRRRKIALRCAWKLTIMQDCLSNSFAKKFANEQFAKTVSGKPSRKIREIPLKKLRALKGKNSRKTLVGAFCDISPKEIPKVKKSDCTVKIASFASGSNKKGVVSVFRQTKTKCPNEKFSRDFRFLVENPTGYPQGKVRDPVEKFCRKPAEKFLGSIP
jgi:DNA-directed RNA polymerase subunit H (RpoH/RPB5)